MQNGLPVSADVAVIRHDRPHYHSGPHCHAQAQFLYAVSGVIRVSTPGGVWVVPPSRAVWLPPGCVHETSSPGTVRFRSLLIDPGALTAQPALPEGCRVVEVSPLLRELVLRLADLAGKSGTEEAESKETGSQETDSKETGAGKAMVEAVIRLMLMELAFLPVQPLNLPMPDHAGLATLCRSLCDSPAHDLPLEQAAATLHMSRATFIRLFRQHTGLSYGRWRQQARLLHALSRLATGDSILETALDCGYDSPSAFSAMFRRALGCPPSVYFRQTQAGVSETGA